MSSSARTPSRGFSKNRIEALIDGIFAVALTLLVLDIKLPENVSYATNDELWVRLKSLERHFVIYVISFVVIAIYWVAHHVQFHYVRYTDRRLLWINMVFLLLISFLPFATDLVGDNEHLVLPCFIYGVTLLTLSAVSSIHLRYLERHPYLATAGSRRSRQNCSGGGLRCSRSCRDCRCWWRFTARDLRCMFICCSPARISCPDESTSTSSDPPRRSRRARRRIPSPTTP
jgi:uncharacterized membrane protein